MKKIMFNDLYGLTQAVLDGRKTMTRRIVHPSFFTLSWDTRDDTLVYENDFGDFIDIRCSKYCPYKVGEIVAVAQSYENCGYRPDEIVWKRKDKIVFLPLHVDKGWRNKMFVRADMMPHQIRITSVRAERLQDISDEDCLREGVGISATDNLIGFPFAIPFNYYIGRDEKGYRYVTPREAFAELIDKTSGRGTWQSNPWVWVYEFELVK